MNPDGTPGPDRPRAKRMLPSVSDVVRELQAGSPADPSLLFKIARQVCAEELGRVKLGQEAAPLDVLVERARKVLDPAHGAATSPKPASPDSDLAFGAPMEPFGATSSAHAGPEDPFTETASQYDLKWGGEAKDSTDLLTEGGALDSPTTVISTREFQGPGEETISRLERDAEGVDLKTVLPASSRPTPRVPVHAAPADRVSSEREAPRQQQKPPEPRSLPRARSSLLSILLIFVGVGVLGLAAYFLVGKKILEDAARPTSELAPRIPRPLKRRDARPSPGSPVGSTAAPPGTSAPATSAAASPQSISPSVSGPPARPKDAVRTTPSPVKAEAKSSPVATRPPAAVAVAPQPAPRSVTASVPAPTSAAPRQVSAPAVPVSQGSGVRLPESRSGARAALLASPDWSGKPSTYVIHFTSYRERSNAEKDAARLSKELGHPGHAVQVDLGAKGIWYRSLVGDFATAEEAQSYRGELAARKTPSLGFVYHLVSP